MATRTWDGGGGDNLASTAANWSSDTAPVGGDAVVFDSTSSKACTWDITGLTFASFKFFGTGDYTGTFTKTTATVVVTGAFDYNDSATINLGTGAWTVGTWNETGTGTDIPSASVNWSGATVNVTGTGSFGFATSSVYDSNNVGTLNIQVGAVCIIENSGDFAGLNTFNYGTVTSTSELNLGRYSTNTGKGGTVWNKSTGVFTTAGGGTMIQCGKICLVNEGTIDVQLGTLAPEDGCTRGRVGVTETYQCPNVIIYATLLSVNPAQTKIEFLGDQIYTGTGTIVLTEDQGAGSVAAIKVSGTIVFHQTSATFDNAQNDPLTWTGLGSVEFVNCGNFSSGTNVLGNMIFSGGSPTLADNLSCQSLTVSGGTFDNATFDVATLDDCNILTPGQLVNTSLNGSAWTVGGSLLLTGVNGTLLNMAATAGWTLTVTDLVYTTANATYVNVKNCNAGSGKQIKADNTTNGGSNTNWNFTTGSRAATKIVSRVALSQSAATLNLEARLSGSDLAVLIDDASILSLAGITLNQAQTPQGLLSYFDGSYQQCPLDYFFMPDPSLVPTAPTGLAVNSTTALATWHAFPGATSYSLRRSPHGANTWTVVGTPTLPTYQDSIPSSGDFDYEVAAVNSHGLGAYSGIVTVTYVLVTGGVGLVAASSQKMSVASIASLDLTADFTMSAWFYSNALGSITNAAVFAKGNAFNSGGDIGFWVVISNSLGWFTFHAVPADGSTAVDIQAFIDSSLARHYVELYWDAGATTMHLLIDNASAGSVSIPAGLKNTSNPFTIGQTPGYSYFDGVIGPVKIWGRLLTGGERTALYNSGTPVPFSGMTSGQKVGLLADWDWLTNGALTTDSSGGGNTLTNTNGCQVANLP